VLASSQTVTAPQLLLKAMVLEARVPQDLVGARAAYEQAAALEPGDWRSLNNLGLLLSSQGEGAAARTASEEAVRRSERQEPAPLFNLAVLLARDEATVELARVTAREVIALGPSAQLDDAQRLIKTLEA
jgi:Flp pilus assembly protein TadD